MSKLVAGREKDHVFVSALIEHRLIDPAVLAERVETVEVSDALRQRLGNWISSQSRS